MVLVFISVTMLEGGVVKGANACEVYYPGHLDSVNEKSRSDQVCNAIYNYFRYYGFYQYWQYWKYSWVTRDLMGSQTLALGYYYSFVALFFKGHDVPWGCGSHYALLGYNGEYIQDAYIYTKTVYGSHDFVFLWACGTAHSYPSWYCSTDQAWTGHCYCWTRRNTLSLDGYTELWDYNPEVFLGWHWGSPNFVDTYGCKNGYDYGSFAASFFKYLLQQDKTVKEALDLASKEVFIGSPTFGNSPPRQGIWLYNDWSYLKIYGNGDVKLGRWG
ncbi:MAG: hypothetical protein QXM52_00455 [Candidatus Bathyarchaeia archaeon]